MRVLTPEGHARELARFTKHQPFASRCWADHSRACSEVAPPKRIGESHADGVHQDMYQCPVCHSLMTTKAAFG